ncbi:hypothetical protein BH10BAC3_BH10BAC3_31110 [soil metagenome]
MLRSVWHACLSIYIILLLAQLIYRYQMMDFQTVLDYLPWLTLSLAVSSIIFKYYKYYMLRKNEHLYFPLKVFGFYSEQRIYSTTSGKKRTFMTYSNLLTVVMYTCLLPHLILLVVFIVSRLEMWLAGI